MNDKYYSTSPRPSEISEKNWSTKAKPFLTSHLWYKAMLKVWKKSCELFRICQLTSTAHLAIICKLPADCLPTACWLHDDCLKTSGQLRQDDGLICHSKVEFSLNEATYGNNYRFMRLSVTTRSLKTTTFTFPPNTSTTLKLFPVDL